MNHKKQARLEAKGWRIGTVKEFLGLSEPEERFIEIKLELARALAQRRKRLGYSQKDVAREVGSSQSRVARMEAGDRSVSVDLVLKSLLRLGATRDEVARAIRVRTRQTRKIPQRKKARSRVKSSA